MSIESITSGTSTGAITEASSTNLDSDDFLQLLLTEIEYQDPLDPMDNTEYVSQLAQLSQLEQTMAIAEDMDAVIEAVEQQTATTALFYLGASVEAAGDSISLEGGEASSVRFTTQEDAALVTANVYDAEGNIVSSTLLGDLEAGTYDFVWDGLDYNGLAQADGEYSVAFSAEDADGAEVAVSTSVSGVVSGVETGSSGVTLTLEDGREVALSEITNVTV